MKLSPCEILELQREMRGDQIWTVKREERSLQEKRSKSTADPGFLEGGTNRRVGGEH